MSNEYKDWLWDIEHSDDPEDHKAWLIHEYPWLAIDDDEAVNYFDVDDDKIYTYIDCAPEGWAKLCEDLCAEIKPLLERVGYERKYSLCQVKEKYGSLRWYDNGVPDEIWKEYSDILYKYEHISLLTCVCCGAPATKISTGWISPFCDECAKKFNGGFTDIK